MKTFLFLLWLLPAACFAQTDSANAKPHDIYCKLSLGGGGFSKVYVSADFGEKSGSAYSLETEFSRLKKELKSLNDEIDGLNYMATQGWELVNFIEDRDRNRTYLIRKKVTY
ncbi:MAG: hypothetical protein EOP42_25240 [Sphingobacteriaceae bacterium]|nr:MAG: hypothetical protein EOP42_25240 [Sphingobacteriaceae bacterium]